MGCFDRFAAVSIPTFALIALFSISSWINVVGLWVELPIMVDKLPEKWSLPSYMTLVIQCCNIAPVIYSLVLKIKSANNSSSSSSSSSNSHPKRDVILAIIIICISILSAFLTSFFWNRTAFIAGAERSAALLSLLTFSSLASCSSALIYLPYMARYPTEYLSAYYFGQGLSGLLPGLIGLGQGLGGNPTCINVTIYNNSSCFNETYGNCSQISDVSYALKPIFPEPKFSVQIFLLLISFLLVISLVSFSLLNFTKLNQLHLVKARIVNSGNKSSSNGNSSNKENDKDGLVTHLNGDNKSKFNENSKKLNENKSETDTLTITPIESNLLQPSLSSPQSSSSSSSSSNYLDSSAPLERPEVIKVTNIDQRKTDLSKSHLIFYLVLIVAINMATNGIIPATQSYTCLPYSNVVYTLTVRLSSVIGSLVSLSTMFLPKPSLRVFTSMIFIALSIVIFHLVVAFLSPNPPLVDTIYGPILIIGSALVMTSMFSFSKVAAASKMHSYGGRKALMWCGAVTQLGSFLGAMLAFALINWASIFKSIPPCQRK